jgi:hypothetical protein
MTADRVGGVIWVLFGLLVFYASWTMDRLEEQGINPVTAPGLLPGLIGLALIAFGFVLIARRSREAEALAIEHGDDTRRLVLSWFLCVMFAGVLLGRGLPFWLLAAVFVFVHILLLEDSDRIASIPLSRRIATAAIIAIGVAAALTMVFQELFLIRLP